MLKYSYWRTVPPTRDWVQEPDFDFRQRRMAGTALRDMWRIYSIGSVGRGMNFALSVDRRGPGPARIK